MEVDDGDLLSFFGGTIQTGEIKPKEWDKEFYKACIDVLLGRNIVKKCKRCQGSLRKAAQPREEEHTMLTLKKHGRNPGCKAKTRRQEPVLKRRIGRRRRKSHKRHDC
jgi:hypothetical protein